jgi:hypothetical protein
MVSEVIVTVQTLCDICLRAEDTKTDATHTHVITVDRRAARQFDTCDRHYQAVAEPLLSVLAEYGTVPEEQRKRRRSGTDPVSENGDGRTGQEIPCPIPGCEQVIKGPAGLSAHVRSRKHTDKERAALARRKKSA